MITTTQAHASTAPSTTWLKNAKPTAFWFNAFYLPSPSFCAILHCPCLRDKQSSKAWCNHKNAITNNKPHFYGTALRGYIILFGNAKPYASQHSRIPAAYPVRDSGGRAAYWVRRMWTRSPERIHIRLTHPIAAPSEPYAPQAHRRAPCPYPIDVPWHVFTRGTSHL
jgi:hypothetical protein